MIVKLYKNKWNVKVKNAESLTVETIEKMLTSKVTKKQQRRAVVKIQKVVRGFLARKKYKALVIRRNDAARYLQRIWKRYRMVTMVPKAWRKFKNDKITKIQKFIRGYMVFKKIFVEVTDK